MNLTRALLAIALLATLVVSMPLRAAQRHAEAVEDELELARRELRQGDGFSALQRYRHANELEGGRCADCLLGMADAMLAMKTYPQALETTQTLLALDAVKPSTQSRAHAIRGSVFTAMASQDPTKFREAEGELRQAIALDADDDYLLYDLGVLLLKQKQEADGIGMLKRFLEQRDLGATADDARDLIANPRRAYEAYIPNVTLTAPDGKKVAAESLRGKVVLFDFWDSECALCVRAISDLRKLQEAHVADPFTLISVSSDEDEGAWRRFTVKNSMLGWPQFWDRGEARARFKIETLPTYVLVDREGVEKMRVSGTSFQNARALREAIASELAR